MKLSQTAIISLVLIIGALTMFFYKVLFLDFPLAPDSRADSWQVETRVTFKGKGEPANVKVNIPQNTKDFVIVNENFISDEFGFSAEIRTADNNRAAKWSISHAVGHQILYYRALIFRFDSVTFQSKKFKVRTYLPSEEIDDAVTIAVQSIIEEIKSEDATSTDFLLKLIKLLKKKKDERINLIKQTLKDDNSLATIEAMILNEAKIPAILVNGVVLENIQRNAQIKQWLLIKTKENAWAPYSADNGSPLDTNALLPWWYGREPMVTMKGGTTPDIKITIKRNTESALTKAIMRGQSKSKFISLFSFFNLPLHDQVIFHVLLLIPLGALIVTFLRQIIGVPTIGTFMPILIALSFREMSLIWGLFLFLFIIAIGLIVRAYFDKLELLFVPRLSGVLIVVVILICVLSIMMDSFNVNVRLSLSLIPLVIVTMMIERMSIMWEELGPEVTVQSALGSLLAGALGYLCLSSKFISYILFVFPELLFIMLALTMMIGRYNGYKLTEYIRFKSFEKKS